MLIKFIRCLSSVFAFSCVLAAGQSFAAESKGKAEHVVVVVWDGMRPDFITPQYTPTLYSLATNGVFFKNHHPVYVSSTEVNGTAIATGVYPNRSGVMANVEYRPEIGWLGTFATEGLDPVRRADLLSDGNYLLVPTLAEILQNKGISTVIAGTKPVALLHDRAYKRKTAAETNSITLFRGQTIPRSLQAGLVKVNEDKGFPTNTTHPNTAADAWTTRALTHGLWKKDIPKYTLLWLSEPDASQHESSPGSDTALAALESSDKNLSRIIKALEERKALDKTDIFVVSDHGFSTINRGPDVADILKKAGFHAGKKFDNPESGDVLVIGLGGSVSIYVMDHVDSVVRKLVEFLQTSDFAGVIFSRVPIEGTFSLEQIRIGTTNTGPDILVSLRWSADKNDYGVPGMITAAEGKKGKGTHASLSRYDMNNTLVAAGPDFKKGMMNTLPSGNADLAPTILHILGVPQPATSPMEGRVLHEALVKGKPTSNRPQTSTLEVKRELGYFLWKQYLQHTEFEGAIYFDEGNGEPVLK